MIGWPQIILIVVVVMLLFGAKRIPDLMGSLGKGIKEFKKATGDDSKELADGSKDEDKDKNS